MKWLAGLRNKPKAVKGEVLERGFDSVLARMENALREGKVLEDRINAGGISRLAVDFNGKRLDVTWYSSGRRNSVTLDGTNFATTEEMQILADCAKIRGDEIMQQRRLEIIEASESGIPIVDAPSRTSR